MEAPKKSNLDGESKKKQTERKERDGKVSGQPLGDHPLPPAGRQKHGGAASGEGADAPDRRRPKNNEINRTRAQERRAEL